MKILIIHQVPYRKIHYHLGIDHQRHEVTYIGQPARMADLPADLRCARLVLDQGEDLVAGILARTSREDGFERLLSLSEFGMIESWHVREHLGLSGASLAQIERVRDKVRMKQALADSGLRYPRFVSAPDEAAQLPWSGKTVVKPRQGASSEGVSVHASAADAVAAWRELAQREDYQLEEYIEGELLHADGLIHDGVLVDLVVSRYVNKPVDFAYGVPLGSYQLPDEPRYRAFAQQVVTQLDIREGCLHLEMFETGDGELVFLEVANRMGGAGVVDAHQRHSGLHLPSHEIAIRLGLERPPALPRSGRYHGWLVFPGHHLPRETGHRIDVPAPLRDHACVDRLHQLAPEQPLPDQITYQEWLAPVFVEASHHDSQALGHFLHECAQSISIQAGAPQ